MKKINSISIILHLFVGIGALLGGLLAILNPHNAAGINAIEALKNSPFTSFLIPGIILFTIIGLGNIFSAFMFRFKSRYQGYISNIFGWALVIWIVVQCIMLQQVIFLHVIYLIIGFIQGTLAMIILFKEKLFPANIFINLYENIKRKAS
ncbi:hypothetical protein DW1_0124 [Proteiniborus sp. DW1]|uniref:hypothetical protein n=1 Tax=Proteiniborus sp. DW1 TaxID=1889883 RepID=UPI00092DF130|nr:hypothetical protein [Proteiniborus sp. DW1]SCG81745.1 hypothetical protein DW1_0124 [Proteiniborus sp. DW1]